MTGVKRHAFRAETQKVLNILTHSLYTNREIFLRELLSNAADALEKLRFLRSGGTAVRDADLPLDIRLEVDKLAGALTVSDTGLGMTGQELADNLGVIARSGSERFARERAEAGGGQAASGLEEADGPVEAGKEEESSAAGMIGRFGVGFYAVFMVAAKVEVTSLSALGEERPHVWASSGAGGFTLRELEGEEAEACRRGTAIRLFLKEDAKEFLEQYRLREVINKHSNFLPFPIFLEGERVNTVPALWREPRSSLDQDRYGEFYRYLTGEQTPPLDVIHFSVDAPVQFTSLIFLPGTEREPPGREDERWGLDLYARRVLIERFNTVLIPRYLAFLRGVVDTEDLPLNISRETLQENTVLRAISRTIVRRVLEYLENMARTDRERYGKFWRLHGRYLQFACADHAERAAALLRFSSSTAEDLVSLDEYLERARAGQREIWHLSAPSPEAARAHPYLDRFRKKGLEVLFLSDPGTEFVVDGLARYKDHPFASVERAEASALDAFADVVESAPAPEPLGEEEKAGLEALLQSMRALLGEEVGDVRASARLGAGPAALVSADGLSSSMERLLRAMGRAEDGLPPKVLEINPDHPLLRSLLRISARNPEDPFLRDLAWSLLDQARLLDGNPEDPQGMARRGLALLDKAASWHAGRMGA
ncbi:MAG: molecular chaperone HtpG [Desulfovibrio sp.]|nr:molecular chaperone HtpG [Desulfovibrio sp.]